MGVNLVEFVGNTELDVETPVHRITEALESADPSRGRRGFSVARGETEVNAIWNMRKKSVGLLGNMQGDKRPIPFVEDTAVPSEHLADYIAEFRALLDARGLVYGMFGHVDAGVLHVRPAINMKDATQEPFIREITEEVVRLTRTYGGLLWGEHGKACARNSRCAFRAALPDPAVDQGRVRSSKSAQSREDCRTPERAVADDRRVDHARPTRPNNPRLRPHGV